MTAIFSWGQTPAPAAQVGTAYKVQLGAAINGVYPFHFTTNDALPDGLTLSDTGLLSGTATTASRGPATFTVNVTDATGANVGSFPFSIVVSKDPPPVPLVIAGATRPAAASGAGAGNGAAAGGGNAGGGAAGAGAGNAGAGGAGGGNAGGGAAGAGGNGAAGAGGNAAGSGGNQDQHNFTFAADDPGRIGPGGSITFTATPTSNNTLPTLKWGVSDPSAKDPVNSSEYKIEPHGPNQAILTLAPNAQAPESGRLSVFACDASKTAAFSASCNGQNASAGIDIKVVDRPAGLMVIPVIGFEQVGASAASSTQKFFFDFFISRPFPLLQRNWDKCKQDEDCKILGPKLRLWGDVRVGSYPQQITSGIGQFATGFATQVSQLPVNQLAQAGEFNLGLEYRMKSFNWLFSSVEANTNERMNLGLVAGFGGISPFNPVDTLQIFQNPAAGSPQATAFFNRFPSSQGFPFTGFTTPDRDRFFWEYGAGIRMTVPFFDKANLQRGSPAMLTYTLGQNQLVSGGRSQGIVQRLEGFYPLPLGERFKDTTLYLFGRVDMRLAAPHQSTPFILQPAPTTVNGFDPNVNIVAFPSNRDIYTIGVGLDAVKLIKMMTLQNQNQASTKPVAVQPTTQPAQ